MTVLEAISLKSQCPQGYDPPEGSWEEYFHASSNFCWFPVKGQKSLPRMCHIGMDYFEDYQGPKDSRRVFCLFLNFPLNCLQELRQGPSPGWELPPENYETYGLEVVSWGKLSRAWRSDSSLCFLVSAFVSICLPNICSSQLLLPNVNCLPPLGNPTTSPPRLNCPTDCGAHILSGSPLHMQFNLSTSG